MVKWTTGKKLAIQYPGMPGNQVLTVVYFNQLWVLHTPNADQSMQFHCF